MASFTTEFALALVLLAFYVVYQLCGKAKPWTVILAVMAAEVGVMGLNGPLFTPVFGSATGAEAVCWMSMHAGEVYNLPGQAHRKPGQPKDKQPQPAPGEEGAPKRMNLANVYIPTGAKVIPGVPVERPPFFSRLWAFILNAGLKEELEKMIPVFVLIWAASASRRPDSKRWGVFEPLDAIVYACAAATAFIIVDTLGGPRLRRRHRKRLQHR